MKLNNIVHHMDTIWLFQFYKRLMRWLAVDAPVQWRLLRAQQPVA